LTEEAAAAGAAEGTEAVKAAGTAGTGTAGAEMTGVAGTSMAAAIPGAATLVSFTVVAAISPISSTTGGKIGVDVAGDTGAAVATGITSADAGKDTISRKSNDGSGAAVPTDGSASLRIFPTASAAAVIIEAAVPSILGFSVVGGSLGVTASSGDASGLSVVFFASLQSEAFLPGLAFAGFAEGSEHCGSAAGLSSRGAAWVREGSAMSERSGGGASATGAALSSNSEKGLPSALAGDRPWLGCAEGWMRTALVSGKTLGTGPLQTHYSRTELQSAGHCGVA
jgi:hypothetical protein